MPLGYGSRLEREFGRAVLDTAQFALQGLKNGEIAIQRGKAPATIANEMSRFYRIAKPYVVKNSQIQWPDDANELRPLLPRIWKAVMAEFGELDQEAASRP